MSFTPEKVCVCINSVGCEDRYVSPLRLDTLGHRNLEEKKKHSVSLDGTLKMSSVLLLWKTIQRELFPLLGKVQFSLRLENAMSSCHVTRSLSANQSLCSPAFALLVITMDLASEDTLRSQGWLAQDSPLLSGLLKRELASGGSPKTRVTAQGFRQ